MTESEFQNFLKGLHIIDRKIVDIAYLSTPDEEERQKRFASLLKKAEQLQAHTEEIGRLWNEAAAKVEEGQKERLKRAFVPFVPFALGIRDLNTRFRRAFLRFLSFLFGYSRAWLKCLKQIPLALTRGNDRHTV